jgi:hypothetical protein
MSETNIALRYKINFRRVTIVAGLASLTIVYALLWVRTITTPEERTGADFIAFYTAGRIAQTYGNEHVYDPAFQQAVQEAEVGFTLVPGQVLLYNHVPYLIPILTVLINSNYVASFIRWAALLIAICTAGVALLAGLLQRVAWSRADIWVAAGGMVTFFPIFISQINGQDTAFIFFGLCLWVIGILIRKDWVAGIGLALTTIRPQVTVLLALPFLFRRQKVFAWFFIFGAILGLVSLVIMGFSGIRSFLDLLIVSASGAWYGLKEPLMINFIGLLWRTVPGLGGGNIHILGWTIYGLSLVGLCGLWKCSSEIGEKQIIISVTLALFAVPHLHYHDLALLIITLVVVMLALVRDGLLPTREASLAPLVISLVLFFGNLVPVLKYNLPYIVMISIVLAACFPEKIVFWRRMKN